MNSWAGGSMKWINPLVIGDKVNSLSTVASVQKKGFEKGRPMVFVNQMIEYRKKGSNDLSVVEDRSHVYLPPGLKKREPRDGML